MRNKEKLRDNFWNFVFFLLVFTLAIVILILLSSRVAVTEKEDIVGGVFIGKIDDDGWNEAHYEGLFEACRELGLPFLYVEDIQETEEACKKAVEELERGGCSVIFLTSDGFDSSVYSVMEAHPEIIFYTVSPESEPENMMSYYGRMYQVRYLAGIIAGTMTKTNVLGFVAANKKSQVVRDINSYLLGARSVNPKATVKVKMIGEWTEKDLESKAAKELIEEDDADVLTYHSSTDETVKVAEKRGVYSIGYNYLTKGHTDNFLAAVVFHWDVMYKAMLSDWMRGEVGSSRYYWWGAPEGAVEIEGFSPIVDREAYAKVREIKDTFAEGNDVFLGLIRSNEGRIMCRKDERMSDDNLLNGMNWFVEGVEIDAE